MFSDCHCHLAEVGHETILNAEKNGFELLLTAGIDIPSSRNSVETAIKFGIVKACVGIHPWYADDYREGADHIIRELAENSEVVAVSEIGLDYVGRMTREWVFEEKIIEKSVQRKTFSEQCKIARELNLPILIHDRAPDQDILDIIEDEGNAEVGVAIHGFSKGPDFTGRCIDMGIYISIGLRPLESGGIEFVKAIEETPIEYLLTETDSNNPMGVMKVLEKISQIKKLTVDEAGRKATENLRNLIRL